MRTQSTFLHSTVVPAVCMYIYVYAKFKGDYPIIPLPLRPHVYIQVWDVKTGKCLLTLVNTATAVAAGAAAAAPAATTTATPAEESSVTSTCTTAAALSPPRVVRTARLAVSRCGRLVAFGNGRQIKVLDFDRLADRSEAARRPGQTGTYLAQALRFVVSLTI